MVSASLLRPGSRLGLEPGPQFDARLTQRTLNYFAHHRGVIHEERSCLIHGLHHSAVYAGRPRNRLPLFSDSLDEHRQSDPAL